MHGALRPKSSSPYREWPLDNRPHIRESGSRDGASLRFQTGHKHLPRTARDQSPGTHSSGKVLRLLFRPPNNLTQDELPTDYFNYPKCLETENRPFLSGFFGLTLHLAAPYYGIKLPLNVVSLVLT